MTVLSVSGRTRNNADYDFAVTDSAGRRIYLNAPAELPPCPPWCEHLRVLPDHGYETVTNSEPWTFERHHSINPFGMSVIQEEWNCAGVVTLGDIQVFDGEDTTYSIDAARERGRAYLEMAAAAARCAGSDGRPDVTDPIIAGSVGTP